MGIGQSGGDAQRQDGGQHDSKRFHQRNGGKKPYAGLPHSYQMCAQECDDGKAQPTPANTTYLPTLPPTLINRC